jgi:hypothetical protein
MHDPERTPTLPPQEQSNPDSKKPGERYGIVATRECRKAVFLG